MDRPHTQLTAAWCLTASMFGSSPDMQPLTIERIRRRGPIVSQVPATADGKSEPLEIQGGRSTVKAPGLFASSMTVEDADRRMGELQKRLRGGDVLTAIRLQQLALGQAADREAQSLAIETLAGAEAPSLDVQVLALVSGLLGQHDPELRFVGIAAASHLPKPHRVSLHATIHALLKEQALDSDCSAAAEAFLMADGSVA